MPAETTPNSKAGPQAQGRRLESWKEIAAYLGRDVTTVRRWERFEGLPVHRLVHRKLGSVYAYTAELDAWRNKRATLVVTEAQEVPPELDSFQRRTWVWTAMLLAGVATVLLLGVVAIRRAVHSASGKAQGRVVIGVAPLQNLSGDPAQDYFVQGLTEEVITQLGQLNPERIGVVRYRSSMAVQQAGSAAPDLGKASALQYFLEGSVRKQDARARISVRLAHTGDGTTVWTDSFDRQIGDVLALQTEIAQRIGRELQIQVLGRDRRKTVAPEVVEAYLRGRFELNRRDAQSDAARAYFERAIALDPGYAPAYAGLADFYRSRAVGNDERAKQAWPLAEQNAAKAVSLDPDNTEAHTAIAQIKLMHDWDWPAAHEHALRALQLNPSSPEAHTVYARYLRIAGKLEEAVNHSRQAVALDPFRADLKHQLTLEYFFSRDHQNAVVSARQALASDPNDPFAHGDLCGNLTRLKLFEESVAECSKALALEGHTDWIPAYEAEYRKHGYEAADLSIARRQLEEVLKQQRPDLWELANAYAAAGYKNETIRTLLQGITIREPGLLQIRVDPDFDGIRDDPRYAELLRQIGFPSK